MSLYQKYRPTDFNTVVGQKSTVKILKQQIIQNKVSHAYLFVGCRGTGKTSIARIFARSVNCLESISGNPCNHCQSCLSSLSESNIDIIEMDAASHNGVDDIRKINSDCQYMPASSKYKVFIIDEVHMLSIGAFNALLKTLEEPPKHCIFILCTTELQKLPATIISRCQRFNFSMISIEDMISRMQFICGEENFIADTEALRLIAKNAQGALRDALSILETCSASNSVITEQLVQDTLGIMDNTLMLHVAEAILREDIAGTLKLFSANNSMGKTALQFVSSLLDIFRDLMVYQSSENTDDINNTTVYIDNIKSLKGIVHTQQLARITKLLSELTIKCKSSFNSRQLVEAELIQLTTIKEQDLGILLAEIKNLKKSIEELKNNGKAITVEKRIDIINVISEVEIDKVFSAPSNSIVADNVTCNLFEQVTPLPIVDNQETSTSLTKEKVISELGKNIVLSTALNGCEIEIDTDNVRINTNIISVYCTLIKFLKNTLDVPINVSCYNNITAI